jgi:uncharacterized membrane protein YfcA
MMSLEALCILKGASILGGIVGLVLILVGYFATFIVLRRDVAKELDSKDVRDPRLVKVIIHTGYIVVFAGCFIAVLSVMTGLGGVLMIIGNAKFWFGH